MLEIFQKTPVWVWVLFGLLIVLGYAQTKERTLSFTRALIIPLVMFFLSLQGIISLFGPGLGIVAWALGMGLLSKMTLGYKVVQSVTYEPQKKLFTIQGSWVWFWVIMGIFWLKFILNVIFNVAAGLLSIPWVFLSASFLLGWLKWTLFGASHCHEPRFCERPTKPSRKRIGANVSYFIHLFTCKDSSLHVKLYL